MLKLPRIFMFCMTLTITFGSLLSAANAFPFGRLVNEIIDLLIPNTTKNVPHEKQKWQERGERLAMRPFNKAITQTGRYRDCDKLRDKTRGDLAYDGSCRDNHIQGSGGFNSPLH